MLNRVRIRLSRGLLSHFTCRREDSLPSVAGIRNRVVQMHCHRVRFHSRTQPRLVDSRTQRALQISFGLVTIGKLLPILSDPCGRHEQEVQKKSFFDRISLRSDASAPKFLHLMHLMSSPSRASSGKALPGFLRSLSWM